MTSEQREKIQAFLDWHIERMWDIPCVRRAVVLKAMAPDLYGYEVELNDCLPWCMKLSGWGEESKNKEVWCGR